jgi:hypothetical protein
MRFKVDGGAVSHYRRIAWFKWQHQCYWLVEQMTAHRCCAAAALMSSATAGAMGTGTSVQNGSGNT